MSISVIVPTLNRPTLERTLRSALHQMDQGDEIIVVADGHFPGAHDLVTRLANETGHRMLYTPTSPTHDSGGRQRDAGISVAKGTHLSFMDDDDMYTRNALDIIRHAIGVAPSTPHIFRMKHGSQHSYLPRVLLWGTMDLVGGNVGTPMFVTPNLPGFMPKWTDTPPPFHDYSFIQRTVHGLFRGQVVWHPEVIALIRPDEQDAIDNLP